MKPRASKVSISSSQKASISNDVDSELCAQCNKSFKESDDGLKCELCEKWVHSICLGIPSEVMKYFNSDSYVKSSFSLPLICSVCKPSFSKLTALSERLDAVEKFESRLAALEKSLAERPIQPQPLLPLMQMPTQPPNPAFDIATLIKSTMEAESKRHNAVLFGLPEEEDDLLAVRKLISDEIENTDNLFVKPSDIIRVFRDGPNYKDSPRFLKVVCVTSNVQHNFIGLVNKVLKQRFANLRARPDLTYEQRVAGRKLRDKLASFENRELYAINYNRNSIFHKITRENVFSLSGANDDNN